LRNAGKIGLARAERGEGEDDGGEEALTSGDHKQSFSAVIGERGEILRKSEVKKI